VGLLPAVLPLGDDGVLLVEHDGTGVPAVLVVQLALSAEQLVAVVRDHLGLCHQSEEGC